MGPRGNKILQLLTLASNTSSLYITQREYQSQFQTETQDSLYYRGLALVALTKKELLEPQINQAYNPREGGGDLLFQPG